MESVFIALLILVGALAILFLASFVVLSFYCCFTKDDNKRTAAEKKMWPLLSCVALASGVFIILAFVGAGAADNKARTFPNCGNVAKMIYSDGDLIMLEHCGDCGSPMSPK